MSLRKVLSFVISLIALTAMAVSAQDAQPQAAPATAAATSAEVQDGGVPRYVRPETPEQRKERLGMVEDPGLDPDPEQVFWRFGKAYKIGKYEKKWAKYTDKVGVVRPMGNFNFEAEIYQENDKYVWAWIEELDPADVTTKEQRRKMAQEAKYADVTDEGVKYFQTLRDEFAPVEPAKSDVHIRFEEASTGLPTGGSWRNSLAVADMNEDGFADLILPPQRGPASGPYIFLGDGTGKWTQWKITFPRAIDYGSVVAADFNKDKNMDLAFAVHLNGVAVFLGDGKGGFREVRQGLPSSFPTRRVVTADVDKDGWLDIVTISEGPMGRGAETKGPGLGNLRAHLNRNKGESWEMITIAQEKEAIGGDWLAAGNFNGDRYPDFIGSSIYFNGVNTLYLSTAAKKYESVYGAGLVVPFRSYYHATAAGPFSSRERDDAIVTYHRRWPPNLNPNLVPKPPLETVVGIDRITFTGKEPKRTTIGRWPAMPAITGLGHGDFNGDGRQDLVFTRHDPREAVLLLGDGAGNFKRATIDGVSIAELRNYDLTVADVNGDAKPDVIVMYESASTTALSPKNGKVQVFLNRGTVRESAAAK